MPRHPATLHVTTSAVPRLFAALPVPGTLRERLAALATDLEGARWSPPEKLHVTLAFLGDVRPEKADAVAEALRQVTAPAFSLRLHGTNVFPSRRHPRVLVVGAERAPALAALHDRAEAALAPLGFAPENRAFRPHVTIARLRNPPLDALRSFLRAHRAFEAEAPVRRFCLYESTLHPDGARYRVRATVPLEAG